MRMKPWKCSKHPLGGWWITYALIVRRINREFPKQYAANCVNQLQLRNRGLGSLEQGGEFGIHNQWRIAWRKWFRYKGIYSLARGIRFFISSHDSDQNRLQGKAALSGEFTRRQFFTDGFSNGRNAAFSRVGQLLPEALRRPGFHGNPKHHPTNSLKASLSSGTPFRAQLHLTSSTKSAQGREPAEKIITVDQIWVDADCSLKNLDKILLCS